LAVPMTVPLEQRWRMQRLLVRVVDYRMLVDYRMRMRRKVLEIFGKIVRVMLLLLVMLLLELLLELMLLLLVLLVMVRRDEPLEVVLLRIPPRLLLTLAQLRLLLPVQLLRIEQRLCPRLRLRLGLLHLRLGLRLLRSLASDRRERGRKRTRRVRTR